MIPDFYNGIYDHFTLFLSLVIFIILLFLVTSFVCCKWRSASKKKVTIIQAEKSFIIKKKVILEKPDPDKSNDSIAPLVKIDYQPVHISSSDQFVGMSNQYEFPLDPEWEFPRDR